MVRGVLIKDIPAKIGVQAVHMSQQFRGLAQTITFVAIRTMNPVVLGATLLIQERMGDNFEIFFQNFIFELFYIMNDTN